jgi:anti-sigma regulatory factor (Ser/Thr protein kinase)
VRQALECGEMVICSAAFPAFESASLAAVLCDVGIDADVALAEARLSVLPSTEVYRNPGPVGLGHGAAARPEDRGARRQGVKMSETTRGSAIALTGHECLLTSTDSEFTTTAASFVREGLDAGEHVLCALFNRNSRLLRETLGTDAGQITFSDSAYWYRTPGRAFAEYHRFIDLFDGRVPAVRVVGEFGITDCSEPMAREWIRYEAALNVGFADRPVRVLCHYDMRKVEPDRIEQALRAHRGVLTSSDVRTNPDFTDPYRLAAGLEGEPFSSPPFVLREFDLSTGSLAELHRLVRVHGRRLDATSDRTDDAVTAISEVADNALIHGRGGTVRLWNEGATLVAEVVNSKGIIDQPLAGYHRPRALNERGLGLWLVRQLCDLIDIRGPAVRLYFNTDT